MYSVFNNIVEDIKSLRGSEVRIFGQPTTLSDSVDEYTIDILDVLSSLENYVIDLEDYIDYYYDDEIGDDEEYCIFDDIDSNDVDGILNTLGKYGYLRQKHDVNNDYYVEYDKCDNSYNWSSPISNDFDYYIYNNMLDGGIFVEFKVHRYGDVRGNYTDSVLLCFNNKYEFYEILSENNKYTTVTVDGVDYDIDIRITSDSYEVYDLDGNYICTAYGDKDDVINCIKEVA